MTLDGAESQARTSDELDEHEYGQECSDHELSVAGQTRCMMVIRRGRMVVLLRHEAAPDEGQHDHERQRTPSGRRTQHTPATLEARKGCRQDSAPMNVR